MTRYAHLISAYYFFFFGAIGCLVPYITLYYLKIGLGGEQIGLITGLGPIVLLIASPLWGAVGDRFNLHRRLLPLATAGAILPALIIPFTTQLVPLIALTILQAIFATAIGPLIDSAAIEIANKERVPFGVVRLWGSVGFIVFSLLMGWLLITVPLTYAFYGYAACMTCGAIVALPLPARQQFWNASLLQGFKQLLAQLPLTLFLLSALLVGAAGTAVQFFFALHVQFIGGDSSVIGIAGAIGAFVEIPILFRAESVIKRIGGLWSGVVIGTAVYALRWWLLASATTPLMIYLTQLLHSVSFGIYLVCAVAYMEQQAPKGLSATAQALLTSSMWGLGAMIGAFGGGILYANFGTPTLFRIASVVTVAALMILLSLRLVKKV